ncbi:phospholysine phosphohistidine inorganic pyrophosphate phosphatase-like [Mya arenaria]|uniref:phospholysine phosphohistidine inorganic pyrophosphate phosphatase-like n=1 Tax=Mya arenaria TaxID=6604 RepID=UPI0022E784A7|nr:phospholysine phosphohistidine inorganic pyrophosphate phosphatase-like [Mya arenaria]XP_052773910.1 phospholysine phosphohistidine inorganic pyrophosphate phosphatase-like [Mya arenaria]
MSEWYQKPIEGVLLDITGVLKDGGPTGTISIEGSVEAVKRLKACAGLQVRFCTNETTITRKQLLAELTGFGFDVQESEIFSPIPAVCQILQNRGLRPHLLVANACMPDFADVDQTNPNCVVIADAESNFSYENLNKAFQLLMSLEKPVLFSLGKGKYYKHGTELVLDAGPFMKGLEYACDITAEVVGKPDKAFFNAVMQDMGLSPDQCVMVGDDIVGDVGGAQGAGMRGVQVRTGKYRSKDDSHPTVQADGRVDNLAQAVDYILTNRT